jgi:hypothetical protein
MLYTGAKPASKPFAAGIRGVYIAASIIFTRRPFGGAFQKNLDIGIRLTRAEIDFR